MRPSNSSPTTRASSSTWPSSWSARIGAEEALELLARIPETPDTRRVAALARSGGSYTSDTEIEARLVELLDEVKADDDARQEFVDLLELLGPEDPRTGSYRRQLTTRLF